MEASMEHMQLPCSQQQYSPPECPSTDEWERRWVPHAMEHSSTKRKNEPFAAARMEPEVNTLREGSRKEKTNTM